MLRRRQALQFAGAIGQRHGRRLRLRVRFLRRGLGPGQELIEERSIERQAIVELALGGLGPGRHGDGGVGLALGLGGSDGAGAGGKHPAARDHQLPALGGQVPAPRVALRGQPEDRGQEPHHQHPGDERAAAAPDLIVGHG